MLKCFYGLLLLLLFYSCQRPANTISMSGAFGLYPIAVKWAEEYKKIHPEVSFDISAGGAGKGMADMLAGNVDFGMLSRDISKREIEKGSYSIAVCIDAVIPTCNTDNPVYHQLMKEGLSKEDFIKIFTTQKVKKWGDVLRNASQESCNVYTRSDAAGAPETWAKYLGKKQEDLKGIGIFGDPGLAEAVKNDKLSIGFNNVVFIYNVTTGKPHGNLSAIPIDKNNNGQIDDDESFYTTLPELVDAIGKGLYPMPPARELYLVSKGKAHTPLLQNFLKWVLSDGQQYLKENGYIQLSKEKINHELSKI
jgi:phosphate transport system substrate-binding protein